MAIITVKAVKDARRRDATDALLTRGSRQKRDARPSLQAAPFQEARQDDVCPQAGCTRRAIVLASR
jgi:hypothetical protein